MISNDLENREQEELSEQLGKNRYNNSDLIIKAKLDRTDIQLLVKLVEGLGHLGVVTTTDKQNGEVMIQTTKDCWQDLRTAIENMPVSIILRE